MGVIKKIWQEDKSRERAGSNKHTAESQRGNRGREGVRFVHNKTLDKTERAVDTFTYMVERALREERQGMHLGEL